MITSISPVIVQVVDKANNRLDQGNICSLMATRQECTVCRVTGGTVFLGTGAYMLYSARKNAPGSRRGKGFIMFVGAGMTTTLIMMEILLKHAQGFYWLV
jgi:ribosomal protein L14